MRKLFLIGVLVLLASVSVGCFNNSGDNDKEPSIDPPVVQEPTEPDQKPDQKEPETTVPPEQTIPTDPYQKLTFKEAFSDEILSDPSTFIQKQIPGVNIGLTEEETIQILGEPSSIENIQHDWGSASQWSYDNVNGYRVIITFNSDGNIFDYKLIKDLIGKGVIPKDDTMEASPDGEPISYTELGFQGVLIGTKLNEVLIRLGEPKLTYLSYDEMYGYNLALVYQGLDLHFSLQTSAPYIKLLETNDLGTVKTARGIQVGSSAEDLIKKYGDPYYDWRETGEIIYATEDYWFALKFSIKNDIVESINIYEAS